jgi:hypothetical protein
MPFSKACEYLEIQMVSKPFWKDGMEVLKTS